MRGAMFIAQAYDSSDVRSTIHGSHARLLIRWSRRNSGRLLVAIAVILSAVGLPPKASAHCWCSIASWTWRNRINVFADAACTVIVARLKGEEYCRRCGHTRNTRVHDVDTRVASNGRPDGDLREIACFSQKNASATVKVLD